MRIRVRHVWERLTSSYWFVPGLMLGASVALASAALWVDRSLLAAQRPSGWFYAGGIEGARTLLSSVAGSVVTVAGVVFSITIAALTQASQQFGPRLLRNFMRDAGNQVVLGTFVATFLYCVLVLRAVPEGDVVPHFAVTVAVLLAVASIGVLVYFIHHISTSMQAPHVVARAAAELARTLEQRYPNGLGRDAYTGPGPVIAVGAAFGPGAGVVNARQSGYLQAIDADAVMRLAVGCDARFEILQKPGRFLLEVIPLVRVWPAEAAARVAVELAEAFLVGVERTPEQDVEYALDQLAEIAVRALSPGVNDPYTAVNCVDRLGDALRRLACDEDSCPWRADAHGVVRVAARISSFEGMVATAFDAIRQHGRASVPVTIRLLETIAALAPHVREPERRAALLRQARMIEEGRAAFPAHEDRADAERRFHEVLRAYGEP